MLRVIYRLVLGAGYYLGYPLSALLSHGSKKWRNRFGSAFAFSPKCGRPTLWAHSASVGETKALGVFLRALRNKYENFDLLVTVMTDRGYETATAMFADTPRTTVAFAPLDAPAAIRRMLNHIDPDFVVFTETEIWPSTIEELRRRKIPLALINARLSSRSFPRYRRLGKIIRTALESYCLIDCQTEEDARRFISLGAPAEMVAVSGNLKSESSVELLTAAERTQWREKLGARQDQFLFVCGSVRPNEEETLLDVYSVIKKDWPTFRIALAPRHDDHHAVIRDCARKKGISLSALSETSGAHDNVTLVDTFGILDKLYGAADLAFVGGTLAPYGGHNVLEPIHAGVPVLFGPHCDNVRESANQVIESGAGVCVQDKRELASVIRQCLDGRPPFSPIQPLTADSANAPSAKILARLSATLEGKGLTRR